MPRGVKGSGPKKQARQAPPVQAAAPVEAPGAPLKSVDIDLLSGEALRDYARKAGVSPRDCDHLTEDRLRQNTKLFIANHFELLTEE
jgi:hypothetical protein